MTGAAANALRISQHAAARSPPLMPLPLHGPPFLPIMFVPGACPDPDPAGYACHSANPLTSVPAALPTERAPAGGGPVTEAPAAEESPRVQPTKLLKPQVGWIGSIACHGMLLHCHEMSGWAWVTASMAACPAQVGSLLCGHRRTPCHHAMPCMWHAA